MAETTGFTPAPAASYAPHEIHTFSTPNDPHDFLPPAAQKKWSALVHRAADLHAAIPIGETVREAAEAVTVHQRRITDLTRLKSEGGNFGLSDDAASVRSSFLRSASTLAASSLKPKLPPSLLSLVRSVMRR